MKRIQRLAALISIILSCAVLAEDPVYFEDATLKAAIEKSLGIQDPTPSDMLSLTRLEVPSQGIGSLFGLEFAHNLERLNLSENHEIDDISPLSDLTQLRWLAIDNNKIDSLSPIGNLYNLDYLNCHETNVKSLLPISGLEALQTLIIRFNRLDNLDGIEGLKSLYRFDGRYAGIHNVTQLSDLGNLRFLYLSGNTIDDVTPLAQMASVGYLDLRNNWVSDMGPLMDIMNDLDELDLRGNPLSITAYTEHIPKITAQYPNLQFHFDARLLDSLYISSTHGGEVIEPGEGLFHYDHNQTINLKASCDPGFTFSGWSGDLVTTTPEASISLSHDTQIKAHFTSMLDQIYVDNGSPQKTGVKEDGTQAYPFDSIQEAIEIAKPGALVIVKPGQYKETINFLGKAITVSSFDPNQTEPPSSYPVIDGSTQNRTVVTFENGEDLNTHLSGFIITGGNGESAAGIFCNHSNPTIEQCVIVGNRAKAGSGKGGALSCISSHTLLLNCSIHGNYGGTNGAGVYTSDSEIVVLNSIIRNNLPTEVLAVGDASPILSYSNIAGNYSGEHNINLDPLFIRPGYWGDLLQPTTIAAPDKDDTLWIHGDYHLRSEAGRWDVEQLTWIVDSMSSPCIDAGDPNIPFEDEPAPNGGRINIGAYGGTNQASKSMP